MIDLELRQAKKNWVGSGSDPDRKGYRYTFKDFFPPSARLTFILYISTFDLVISSALTRTFCHPAVARMRHLSEKNEFGQK